MKKIGELCKIDSLGRVVIPKRIRIRLDIKPGEALEVYTDDEGIMLRKYIQKCIFCGNEEKLSKKDGKCICAECVSYFTGVLDKE